MDTSDPKISFNEEGRCNHCTNYPKKMKALFLSEEEKARILTKTLGDIKEKGKNKRYDCIIGVSGGLDSSFLAYKIKELGLRPLAVHLDNGWNTDISVSNIQRILEKLEIDLYTEVLDWEIFKDLQVAFLRSSTPDVEIPTDHAILSLLYDIAKKEKVKYFVSGSNLVTEAIMPYSWSQGHTDWRYIKSVYKKFGNGKNINKIPHKTAFGLIYNRRLRKNFTLLNYVEYKKEDAFKLLNKELGYQYYGSKHHESLYTKFVQSWYLLFKFGYDKRRGHLSTLVCSGQVSRDEALKEMKEAPYPFNDMKNDMSFVLKKLGMNESDFQDIMYAPNKTILDYSSNKDSLSYKLIVGSYLRLKKLVKS
jgi:N-acetyl sugar amidotransferase